MKSFGKIASNIEFGWLEITPSKSSLVINDKIQDQRIVTLLSKPNWILH